MRFRMDHALCGRRDGYIALFSCVFFFICLSMRAEGAVQDVSFDVIFESNGGSYIPPYTNVSYNSLISEPGAPVRSGHEFEGWYMESALLAKWDFGQYRVTENMKLYAKWAKLYRITVIDGYADRVYAKKDQRVEIRAEDNDWYWDFRQWDSEQGGVSFADRYKERTSFQMPDRDVRVRAVYRYDDDSSGGCGTGAGTLAAVAAGLFAVLGGRRKRDD